ncbi:hypothetical protein LWI28_023116 [Acer negundo]|uniref:Uncharacterized protein n=1 Tax=Acer negundo TaxID=4023 RepID=A0AAD5I793_ACENE|nr:hypothetical protein LWI28_023116 [Acer negundo]
MTFSAFLHLGLIDNAGALHCRISKRMFSFEDHNGISEAIYPDDIQPPSTASDGIRHRQLARRRRVFESSRSEQQDDVVNLSSSRFESASSLRSGNISSIWVQFQVPCCATILRSFINSATRRHVLACSSASFAAIMTFNYGLTPLPVQTEDKQKTDQPVELKLQLKFLKILNNCHV